jgi:IclR family transcriptional regulator, acetate operon repressor
MKRSKTDPYPGTQSVWRAFALLKSFSEDHPRWALHELAKRHGYSKTTAYRLLSALEHEGFVEKDESAETYGLGPAVMELAGRAMRSSSLHQASQAELRGLVDRVGETASLEVLVEHEVLILDEIPAERLMTGRPWIGTRWPAYATSTGRAILALLPEDQRDVILRRPMKRFTPKTITDPVKLAAELEMASRHGFAVTEEELELGFTAVGSVVRGRSGEPVAALGIGGPSMRITPERIPQIGSLVRAAAARVSARLGYQGK